MLLSEQQATNIASAIADIEKQTDAELVTVLARQADNYVYIPTLWAALLALISPGLFIFAPFWLTSTDMLIMQLSIFLALAITLRIRPLMRWIIPTSVLHRRASNLAKRSFLESNLHHTIDATGILIFVAENERYVEIIADRGINALVDQHHWQQIVDNFTLQLANRHPAEGFLKAIEACGTLLIEHVPATKVKNELPNHLIIID